MPEQPTRPERLSVTNLTRNFLTDLLNADRGMLGTLVQLVVKPERVVNTFLYQDRKRFIRPTRFVLFAVSIIGVTYLGAQIHHGEPIHEFLRPYLSEKAAEAGEVVLAQAMRSLKDADGNLQPHVHPDIVTNIEGLAQSYEAGVFAILMSVTKYSSYYSLFFIPLNALLYWFIFPRKGFNYAESLAATGYISGFHIAISVLMLPFIFFASTPAGLAVGLNIISTLQLIYLLYATYRVFANKITDALIALIIFMGICLLLSVAGSHFAHTVGVFRGYEMAGKVPTFIDYLGPGIAALAYTILATGLLLWRFGKGGKWAIVSTGVAFVLLLVSFVF